MDNGVSREQVFNCFAASAEFRRDAVSPESTFGMEVAAGASGTIYRLYQATLDRAPDAEGLPEWAEVFANGARLQTVVRGFI